MDCAQSGKKSTEQLEVRHKETDSIPDRSNSNSSSTSDLSQDSADSSILQSDPPAVHPKPDDAVESLGGSTPIPLSGVLGNHDPNRIPASIFSSKPSNPMEWSTASNESLFSIHVGNNSFSREQFNFLKSGELMMMNPNSSQNLPTLPPFVEPAARVEISKTEINEPGTSTGPQIPAAILSQSVADHTKEAVTPMDEHRGRQSESNDSMNSSHSFQFPLLGGEGATPKTISSVSTYSGTTPQQQQQPVMKLQSSKQQSPEHQPPSHETTSASPTAKSGSGWFSCFYWCRRR